MEAFKEGDNLSSLRIGDTLELENGEKHIAILSVSDRYDCDCKLCSLEEYCYGDSFAFAEIECADTEKFYFEELKNNNNV